MGLVNWKVLRLSVYRCATTEYELPDTQTDHGIQDTDTTAYVIAVVGERILHGLPYSLQTCEVDNGLDAVSLHSCC